MKKHSFFLSLIFALTFHASGQSMQYCHVLDSSDRQLYIRLLIDEQSYSMELCDEYCDLYLSSLLSFGSHHKVENNLSILYDNLNGYTLVLRREMGSDVYLESTRCDPIKFIRLRDTEECPKNRVIDSVAKQKCNVYKEQTDAKTLVCGIYEPGYHPSGSPLCIFEDGRYTYSIFNFIVSKGRWEREGNLLVFHDDCLGEVFYALIGEDCLLGCNFWGFLNDQEFRILSPEEYDEYYPRFESDSQGNVIKIE